MITLNGVTKRLDQELVLDHISLTLPNNLIHGFVGENGSGKTMLFRAICGLICLDEGEIIVDGKKIDADHLPAHVGLLLEAPAFLNYLTGKQNLKMLSYLTRGITDKEIEQMLIEVGLAKAKHKNYGKYSLGMKQRLGLALAFLHHPSLILLDEPTNALDAKGIEVLIGLLHRYRSKETTILIASHDSHFLSQVADRIYPMEKGKLALK